MSTTFYDSRSNIMKRDNTSGSASLNAPATPAYIIGSYISLYVTNYQVAHNLGYQPQFRIYYEPFNDGVIWPPLTSRLSGPNAYNPLNGSQTGPGVIAWADSTNLYIQLFYGSNTLTGNFPVYWVIYRDYKLAV